MIEKYLREIEISGMVLVIIGILLSLTPFRGFSGWFCGLGMLLWLITFLYMAFHWSDYERQNKQNIMILLVAIAILLAQMLLR
ncbi:MAG: hypothetical protein J1E77_08045 [Prevotella sp.]|nr:hypothetical protein [Prevotella sp.]